MIFIDGNNLYYSLKKLNIERLDFNKFINGLANNFQLVRTYYYNAPLDISINKTKYWKQQKFFNELNKIPNFKLILCKLRKHKRNQKNYIFDVKGDDVYLAVDLISGAYEDLYDIAIIVSGDEDFVPAIKKAQSLGKEVINAYFKSSSSSFLKKTCNSSIFLDNLIRDL